VAHRASRILVVEDEPAIAELLALHLRHGGHDPIVTLDTREAHAAMTQRLPDLVLVDWMLPGTSGVQFARALRADERTRDLPIILLTAKSTEEDKVIGLEAGADDYVVKPFASRELLARIKAVLRRRAPHALDEAIELDGLRLDPVTHRVGVDKIDILMGPTEFRLLHFLMTHPERVHSRSQLLDRVWGDHVELEERTVDVHIKRLRDSLAAADRASMIDTVRGAGYRFARARRAVP
jgi:two-component system, OmpR family, phosphate regulon response regulator PhoB